MTELTRRRLDESFESWGIFYRAVKVGGLSEIHGTDGNMIWQWSCGFYPGCNPRQQTAGNEDRFDDAKAAFSSAWEWLRPQITDAMLTEWREHQAFTDWKYAMIDGGFQMPTQSTTGRSRCFCGDEITINGIEGHIHDRHIGTKEAAEA